MKKYVVFGLGNPGEQFSHTRHNLGADMVLAWLERMARDGADVSDWNSHEKFHARVCEVRMGDVVITVLAPLVFMNESGKVLSSYLRYHPLERKNILVVHDDLELPLGEVKLQQDGSAHGHNGVRSIHEFLGDTDVPRLRIGISRPADTTPVDKFVLATFTPDEKTALKEREAEISEAITSFVDPLSRFGRGLG
ncbi:MAG: aminoacyl-tRNA hydrolase [Candidatus Andersenbacteria bacterium RIFCSPHIGHO2_02_FULL_45_11]|nr:MAG: aminoacyl-tRNA hydrolase [Candidatus Andersenbacteria bacterium RIFCSPHIGHO2_01_FULL_46_36]OGY32680.1 MAG: aminoacyl-tRNA hydrolase [Candidatus Andersenbacteria bacterium RIFCSPHIGHO2_02_FULL_45_11]